MRVIVENVDDVIVWGEFPEITEGDSTYVVYKRQRYYVVKGEKGVRAACRKLVNRQSFDGAGYIIQSSLGEWCLMTNADVEKQGRVPPSVQDAGSVPPPCSIGGGGGGAVPPSVQDAGSVPPPCSIGGGGGGAVPPSVQDAGSVPPPCSIGGGGGGGGAAPLTPAVDSMDLTEAAVDSPFRIDDATLGRYDGKTYFNVTVGLPYATKPRDVDVKTPNKEVLMLLPDVSSSMASSSGPGDGTTRMDELKKAMHYIIKNSDGQQVVIVPWSHGSDTAFHGVIDENTKERARDIVDSLHPGGSTNMVGAIEFAGNEMRKFGPGVPIHLIMLTDGEPYPVQKGDEIVETCREVFKGLDLSVTTIGLNVGCKREVLDLKTGIPTVIEDPNRRNFLFVGESTESLTVQLAQLLAVQTVEKQAVQIKISFPVGVTAEAMEGDWTPRPDNTFEQTGNVSDMSEIKALFRLSLPDAGLPTGSIILVETSDPEDNSRDSRHEIPLDGSLPDTDYNVGVLIENLCLKTLINQHTTSPQMYEDLLARLAKIPDDTLNVWSKGELPILRNQVGQIILNLGTKQQEHVLAAKSSVYRAGSTGYRSRSAQVSAELARESSSGYSYKGHGGGGGSSSDSMDLERGSMSHKPPPTSHRRRLKASERILGPSSGGGGGGGGYRS